MKRGRRGERHFHGVMALGGEGAIAPHLFAVKDLDEDAHVSRCRDAASFIDNGSSERQSDILAHTAAVGNLPCAWLADVFYEVVAWRQHQIVFNSEGVFEK